MVVWSRRHMQFQSFSFVCLKPPARQTFRQLLKPLPGYRKVIFGTFWPVSLGSITRLFMLSLIQRSQHFGQGKKAVFGLPLQTLARRQILFRFFEDESASSSSRSCDMNDWLPVSPQPNSSSTKFFSSSFAFKSNDF